MTPPAPCGAPPAEHTAAVTAPDVVACAPGDGGVPGALDRAWADLAAATDTARLYRATTGLGRILFTVGRSADAAHQLDQARQLFLDGDLDGAVPPREHADTLILLAAARRAQGRSGRAATALHDALALLVDRDENAADNVRRLLREVHGAGAAEVCRLPRRWGSRATRMVADAHGALTDLERTARHSAFGAALARSSRLRDVRARAHLTGLHLSLPEVFLADLAGRDTADGAAKEALVNPLALHLRADALAHDDMSSSASVRLGLIARLFADALDDHPDPERTRERSSAGVSGDDQVARLLGWTWERDSGPPPVAKAILAHLHLAGTRPARAGDLVAAHCYLGMELRRQGLLDQPRLPLSDWIRRHHHAYLAHRVQAGHTGDTEAFVAFLAEGITDVCEEESVLLRRAEELRVRLREVLAAARNYSLDAVLTEIIGFPFTTIRNLTARLGIATDTVSRVVPVLVDAGVLASAGRVAQRKVWYCAAALDLLIPESATEVRAAKRGERR